MNKKYKYIIFTLFIMIISIFDSTNVFAADNYCSYLNGIFTVTGKSIGGLSEHIDYSTNKVLDKCGRTTPCVESIYVKETTIWGNLDRDKWLFIGSGNSFNCITIYYLSDCYQTEESTNKCSYTFYPSAVGGLELIPLEEDSKVCITNLKEDANGIYDNFESLIGGFEEELQTMADSDYASFSKNLNYYIDNRTSSEVDSAISKLSDYRTTHENNNGCSYTSEEYNEIVKELTNKISKKVEEIGNNVATIISSSNVLTDEEKTKLVSELDTSLKSVDKTISTVSSLNTDTIETDCEAILTDEAIDFLNRIIRYIRIFVPILLVVFGVVDFGKCLISDDKDDMKKATSKFMKRCVIAVAIFFVPTIISFLVDIFNAVSDNAISDAISCGIE